MPKPPFITKDNMAALQKSIRELTKREILVGIPSDETQRKEGTITNAAIGYINEFGSPAKNIPARPFLIPGVQRAEGKIEKRLKKSIEHVLDGSKTGMITQMNAAGLEAQNSVRATINKGIMPELSESTLAARRRRGRTGEKPLIDTGQLRNSITYILKESD